MRVEFESVGSPSLGDVETPNNQAVAVTTASSDLLQRIADTIGVTVDMLRDDPPTRADRSPATTAEVHALLDALNTLQVLKPVLMQNINI